MVKSTNRIDHIDTKPSGSYDSDDLNYFDDILAEILKELSEQRSPLASPANEAATKAFLATWLFKSADGGERDRNRLKSAAVAYLTSVYAAPGAASPRAH